MPQAPGPALLCALPALRAPGMPGCQRAAAVGFQCVDCVNEAKRTTPAVRTVYGGAVAAGKPLVTFVIIALCAAGLRPAVADSRTTPCSGRLPTLPVLHRRSEPWRMLTSAFLHSQGFLLAHRVEHVHAVDLRPGARTPAGPDPVPGRVSALRLGRIRGLPAADADLSGGRPVGVVGASGAIFGLFGAMLVVQRHRGGDIRQLWVLIAINGVIGFMVPQIAWQAHLAVFRRRRSAPPSSPTPPRDPGGAWSSGADWRCCWSFLSP